MTREEQIIKIGAQFAIDETDGQTSGRAASMRGVLLSAFRAGAQWADSYPHWFSVEDELPKADGRYIIADKYDGVEQMNFDAESKYWWLRGTGEMSDFVTHWMPLPQPPRKEDKK